MSAVRAFVVTIALALAVTPAARAHEGHGFSLELFEPQPALGRAILGVGTTSLLAHAQLALGLFGHYQDDPLTMVSNVDRDEVSARLVDSRWTVEVLAAVGLFDLLQLEAALPLVVSQSGDDLRALDRPGESVGGFALGDLRVALRARVVDTRATSDDVGFGLALALPVALPIGDAHQLASDGAVRLRPTLALDYGAERWRVALEVGYELRADRAFASYTSDDQIRWAVAGRAPLGDLLRVVASVQGAVGVGEQPIDDTTTHPIELLGGLELVHGGLVVAAGAGAPLLRGVGSPDVRAWLALGFLTSAAPAAAPTDDDGDGLIEGDKCPDFAEDKDGFQDHDGCPDPDNDIDGIPDEADQCPGEAEDYAGPEDGCPTKDKDLDGIADPADRCPDEPEDQDGDRDDDGCPDQDTDGDGVDAGDACPEVAEDKDGFEDADGCPDPDNDQDGLPDASDQCPDAPETKNGKDDADGCPDTIERDVELTSGAIVIKQQVQFGFDSDKIRDKSFAILDAVARVLADHPFIKKVSVEGHTDSEGAEDANLDLSTRRAASVVAYLVGKGVAPERLASKGFGESVPLKPNTTPAGRVANRRVEFKIVDPAPRAP
ncbi:MAG: OmpA family protein [Deltaproteobacteria bacterium]|nr:OmpA family protein [Deltaproteobacteria bacterium]